jgi:DinB superfamily
LSQSKKAILHFIAGKKIENQQMDKSQIIERIRESYGAFQAFISSLPADDITLSLNGEKWSAGQQLEHLCLSVAPLNKGLKAPEFALKAMFGKADHDSISYDDLVDKYQSALAAGGSATAPFRPAEVTFERKAELLNTLNDHVDKLCRNVEKYDEAKLDSLVLPHPLIGKLTIREMLYFTIYHAEHHLKHTRENLASRLS